MSTAKGQTSIGTIMNNAKSSLLPPKSPFPCMNSRHHRASSESFLVEKPSWLDELLDEPEFPVQRGAHRRSSSDSFAYIGKANLGMNYVAHDYGKINGSVITPLSSEKKDVINVNSSEAAAKRARQRYAQRSRVRKHQYIAELERVIQTLQATCAEIRAEIETRRQKNAVLRMQNEAMAMRLESLSQAQLMRQYENEVLEREIKRLRLLEEKQKQPQAPSSHGRANINFGQLFANLSLIPNSVKKE